MENESLDDIPIVESTSNFDATVYEGLRVKIDNVNKVEVIDFYSTGDYVAESTEILAPISQLGCAQACSGVTEASDSMGASRKGPPDAVG